MKTEKDHLVNFISIMVIITIGVLVALIGSCHKTDNNPATGYITNTPGVSSYYDPSGLTEEYHLSLDTEFLINYSENLKYRTVIINGFIAQGDEAVMTKKLFFTVDLADIKKNDAKKVKLLSGYKLKSIKHRLSITLSFLDDSANTVDGSPGATKEITLSVYTY